ncbi:MAG: YtxH domain-containing protein [Chitinophagaceae bacterium]
MTHSKFFKGVAVGVILGLLFAPQSGKKTRAKIGKAKDKVKDFAESAMDKLEGFKNDAGEMIRSGRSKVNTWKEDAESANS